MEKLITRGTINIPIWLFVAKPPLNARNVINGPLKSPFLLAFIFT